MVNFFSCMNHVAINNSYLTSSSMTIYYGWEAYTWDKIPTLVGGGEYIYFKLYHYNNDFIWQLRHIKALSSTAGDHIKGKVHAVATMR